MNFKEWLISEAQSVSGNRNPSSPRLLNVGPTRDFTQPYKDPSRSPFWVQVAQSFTTAFGRLYGKARWDGVDRPQAPVATIDDALWKSPEELADMTAGKWPQSAFFDITTEWSQGGTPYWPKPNLPISQMKKDDRDNIAFPQITAKLAKQDKTLAGYFVKGLPDKEGNRVKADINETRYRTHMKPNGVHLEIIMHPARTEPTLMRGN